MINPRIVLLGIFLAAACLSCSRVEKENVETPAATLPKVQIAQIEEGIKNYIREKTEKADGFFHVRDKDEALRMKLVRVHTEYLSNLGPKRHFACVDLAEVSGDVYDVDF